MFFFLKFRNKHHSDDHIFNTFYMNLHPIFVQLNLN
jgi:hypothetical protein